MDRHAATRRLRRLADQAGVRIARTHPHMLRHPNYILAAFKASGT
jgi:site-specific recombinase XerD